MDRVDNARHLINPFCATHQMSYIICVLFLIQVYFMSENTSERPVYHTVLLSALEKIQGLYFLTVILCHFLPPFCCMCRQSAHPSQTGWLVAMASSCQKNMEINYRNKNITFFRGVRMCTLVGSTIQRSPLYHHVTCFSYDTVRV